MLVELFSKYYYCVVLACLLNYFLNNITVLACVLNYFVNVIIGLACVLNYFVNNVIVLACVLNNFANNITISMCAETKKDQTLSKVYACAVCVWCMCMGTHILSWALFRVG